MAATSYSIPTSSIEAFKKVLARANRKAEKLGVAPFVVTYGAERAVTQEDGTLVLKVLVTIDGATPSYKGFTLTGVISPLKGDDGRVVPLVTTVPGETVSEAARNPAQWDYCDHCRARRVRHETFVVRSENGTERQVGRNCLADFLGGAAENSADALASLAGLRTELDGAAKGFAASPASTFAWSLIDVMAVTIRQIALKGWVSVGEAQRRGVARLATRERVGEVFQHISAINHARKYITDPVALEVRLAELGREAIHAEMPTPADTAEATQLFAALGVYLDTESEKGELNDYLATCRTIYGVGAVSPRVLGVACSMVNLARKACGIETAPEHFRLLNAAKSTSTHLPLKRADFAVTLVDRLVRDTFILTTFVDDRGNILKTFGTVDGKLGDKMKIRATPVKHGVYNNVKDTVINRVVVAE